MRGAERWPDADAIVINDERHTYAELEARAIAVARSLVAAGVGPRDHVGLLVPNCMDGVETLFGAALAGAVVVPINARFRARELAHVINDGDLRVIVTSDVVADHVDFVALLHEALPNLASAPDPSELELPEAPELRAAVLLGSSTAPGFVSASEFAAGADRIDPAVIEQRRSLPALRDPAIMIYTSGTTAMPKGCPLSHEALVRTSVEAGRTRFRFRFVEGDRFWDPLPMFHMSFILPLIGVLDAGGTFISMTHFEPAAALAQLEREGVTGMFPTFPAVTQALLNHPDYRAETLAAVRITNNVAPPDTLRAMQAAMPQAIQISAYGLTECGGVVAFNDPDDTYDQRMTTQGQPFAGIEVCAQDAFRELLPPGERGELCVRGYNLFDGYYKDPERTAEVMDGDGWFHTGDIGVVDAEGRVSYQGRIKDMLKVGGENVAAIEIESYLATHPAVSIAQVVGVPDPKYMEVPAAFLELKPGASATEDEIIAFCTGGMSRFKVPRYVRFVTEWPMSATKVQKYRLRDLLAEELGLT